MWEESIVFAYVVDQKFFNFFGRQFFKYLLTLETTCCLFWPGCLLKILSLLPDLPDVACLLKGEIERDLLLLYLISPELTLDSLRFWLSLRSLRWLECSPVAFVLIDSLNGFLSLNCFCTFDIEYILLQLWLEIGGKILLLEWSFFILGELTPVNNGWWFLKVVATLADWSPALLLNFIAPIILACTFGCLIWYLRCFNLLNLGDSSCFLLGEIVHVFCLLASFLAEVGPR